MKILRLAAISTLLCAPLIAQMEHKKSEPSTTLTITGPSGKVEKLSPADLKALPHKTVEVYNEHAKAKESYSGVPLAKLLKRVDVPTGEKVRGKLYLLGVIAEGTDHYKVLYSIGEVDSANHTGEVLVADQVDGKPIDTDGAFKLVSSEEKRPARWVRNLTAITVKAIE